MNVMLIGEDGKVIGNVHINEAKRQANLVGKDLVLVNQQKNIYKIADKGKLKYEMKQREKQARAQQRAQKIKEMQFTPQIAQHDIETKINHIKEFLTKGHKTKITMAFRGRQMNFKDVGMEKITYVLGQLAPFGTPESAPKFEGRDLIVYISPK